LFITRTRLPNPGLWLYENVGLAQGCALGVDHFVEFEDRYIRRVHKFFHYFSFG
jgi:hypothetical protein